MDQNPLGIFTKRSRSGARIASFFREDRPKLNFQWIVARAIGMLIRERLLVVSKQRDKLRNFAVGCTVVQQILLWSPVAAFLGFLNGFESVDKEFR